MTTTETERRQRLIWIHGKLGTLARQSASIDRQRIGKGRKAERQRELERVESEYVKLIMHIAKLQVTIRDVQDIFLANQLIIKSNTIVSLKNQEALVTNTELLLAIKAKLEEP